ncbi:hypothetical protein LZC95_41295 [Pendulispora brunnea]|uniref:Uncharacterized protein n=1 Tax=Pendulispora brunnea TaxID=2905690 RepID=A0ABZ2K6H2_9BACT
MFTLSALGCSSSDDVPGPTPTVADGTIEAASFAGQPRALVATDETGRELSVPLDPGHRFRIELPEPHTYHLSIETDRGRARIVFPRGNRTDSAFSLTTTGALIHLGRIRRIADLASPVVVDAAQCVDGTVNGAGICTTSVSRIECSDQSTSYAHACSDVEVVLGYGPLDKVPGVDPTRDTFAVPALSPPCEVYGCNVPPPPPDENLNP